MNELAKRVAYLKGLAEGFQIDTERGEGKLLMEIIDTLDQFSDAIQGLGETQDEMNEYMEDIDESVCGMEELLFGDEDDLEDDDEDDDDDGLIEYDCPHCGSAIFFDEESFTMEEKHICPNCNKPIFSEEDDEDEDGDE